jgi:hypothetical protein
MALLRRTSQNIHSRFTSNNSYKLIRQFFLLFAICFIVLPAHNQVHAIPEKTSVIATTDSLAASRPITTGVIALGGGEACAAATVIGALPFLDTGSTCGFSDTYFALYCGGIGGKDCAYEYTPASDITVDISLCGSSYDTILHMYENACAWTEMACNDDYCGLGSQLEPTTLLLMAMAENAVIISSVSVPKTHHVHWTVLLMPTTSQSRAEMIPMADATWKFRALSQSAAVIRFAVRHGPTAISAILIGMRSLLPVIRS